MKILLNLTLLVLWTGSLLGQVNYQRLLNADDEPGNWLTYSRTYNSQRYSHLNQIRKANVKNLELKWVFQAKSLENFEATPLVVDGVMYLTRPPNVVVALDARTGRVFWTYHHKVPKEVSVCCGRVNRGLAILDDLLFLGTLDAHLQAIDAKTGSLVWDVKLADFRDGYAVTMAPLVVKDKVIVGMAGGEYGIRGFLEAYEAKTGKRSWRFHTIPGPGEPGNETWEGDSWKTGGGVGLVDGLVRPGVEPALLGNRQPQPRLER